MNLLQLAANLERNKKKVGFRDPTFIEILHSSLSSLISLPLKAPPGFFLQLPYLPEETCFQQVGSSVVEGNPPSWTGIFCLADTFGPAEGTSQPVIISKK
jgi:hypothetical protein